MQCCVTIGNSQQHRTRRITGEHVAEDKDKALKKRENLIELVERIRRESGCVFDVDGLLEKFEQLIPNKAASQLIFDPPDGRPRTAEEIVDEALGG